VTYLINLGIYLPMLLVNIWGIKWFGRIDTVVTVVQVFGIFAFLVVRPRSLLHTSSFSHPFARTDAVYRQCCAKHTLSLPRTVFLQKSDIRTRSIASATP
jgi:amino acid transporter